MTTPPSQSPQRAAHDAHVTPNARLGLIVFLIYFALYLGFMGIAAFKYEAFATVPFAGVNLAVWYGVGLIVAAIVLLAVLCEAPRGQADRHAATRRHTVRLLKVCLCAAQIDCVCRLVIRLCERRGGEHRDKACEQKLHQNFPYAYANGFALPQRNSKYQSPNALIMSI
jgi:uncharacterized membrane protein (DUF485 family)